MDQQKKIYIVDVTNRDGVQTSRLGLAKLEKTILNINLNQMGVYQSEFGFPTTKHEINYLNANLELTERGILAPIRLEGWCRAIRKDVELAVKNCPKIKYLNLSMSTSKQMIKGKFQGRINEQGVIDKMVDAVAAAKEAGIVGIGVNAEDASRTDLAFLEDFSAAAKAAGAERLRYCDTLGFDDPTTIHNRINHLASKIGIDMEIHCHNDLGMAVGCSLGGAMGAIEGGVNAFVNTTVNGMGERAGNCDLVAFILAVTKSSGIRNHDLLDERIDLLNAWKIAKYASYAFGIPIPINQPAVGANAFAHESGIHADGALKDRRNYELYDFEELGRGDPELVETGRMITTGEYGGIKGFRNVYSQLEVEFKSDKEATEVLELVRYANVHTQKPLTDSELLFVSNYPEIARQIMTVTP